MAAASTVAVLQKNLDAMVRSGSPVDCSKAYAGPQEIGNASGEITWKRGQYLRISSGQDVFGRSMAGIRITYLGLPEDPPAFEIWSYSGNGFVDSPSIKGMQIHCPNGGKSIGVHKSVKTLKRFTAEEITTTGGVILNCEQYATLLDIRSYVRGQQALLIGGGGNYGAANVIRRFEMHGYTLASNAKAAVEIHGAAQFDAFPWFEDINDAPEGIAPALYFGDWVEPNGYSHRGNFAVAGLFHDEAHSERTWAVVDRSDFHAINIGGTGRWPWQVKGGGAIHLQREPHKNEDGSQTVISPDNTGKLYVRGQAVAIEPQR